MQIYCFFMLLKGEEISPKFTTITMTGNRILGFSFQKIPAERVSIQSEVWECKDFDELRYPDRLYSPAFGPADSRWSMEVGRSSNEWMKEESEEDSEEASKISYHLLFLRPIFAGRFQPRNAVHYKLILCNGLDGSVSYEQKYKHDFKVAPSGQEKDYLGMHISHCPINTEPIFARAEITLLRDLESE